MSDAAPQLGPPPEQLVTSFQRDGYVVVPGLLAPDEARALREEAHAVLDRLASRHPVEATWSTASMVADAPQRTELLHCHDVQYHAAVFGRWLFEPRIIDLAAALMGTDDVQLHHNKLFVKPPSIGSPFPMHQDWPFFPHERDTPLAIVVHLDDAPVERGCVRIVPGSHRRGRMEHLGDRDWYLDPADWPIDDATPVPARAGDVLCFGSRVVHGSGVNTSDAARTTWLIQVVDPTDRPTVDRHRSPGQGTMLRGVAAGPDRPPTMR